MLRDPRRYSCPEQFNPERFLARDGFEPETDPRQMVFGFGRRYGLTAVYAVLVSLMDV